VRGLARELLVVLCAAVVERILELPEAVSFAAGVLDEGLGAVSSRREEAAVRRARGRLLGVVSHFELRLGRPRS
jgi:hypothetical protein